MEDFEKAIQANNLKRQVRLINQFGDEETIDPEFEKGLPIGHINAHGKQKQSDGSWKYVGKGKKGSKEESEESIIDRAQKVVAGGVSVGSLKDAKEILADPKRQKRYVEHEDVPVKKESSTAGLPKVGSKVTLNSDVNLTSLDGLKGKSLEVVGTKETGLTSQPTFLKVKDDKGKVHEINPSYVSQDKKDTKGTEKKEEKSTDWNLYRARGGKTYQFTETGKGERRLIHLEATDGSHKINMTWDDEGLAKKYADRFAFPMKSDPKALREAKIANAIAYDEVEGKLRAAQAAYSAAVRNAGRKELKEAEREKLKEIEMDALQKVYDIDTIYRRVVRNRNKLGKSDKK